MKHEHYIPPVLLFGLITLVQLAASAGGKAFDLTQLTMTAY